MPMDLTLLSPEVQAVIASADIDKICDMCERVRGRDGMAYRVLQDVADALRNWSDFETERGPDGITEGAQLMVEQAHKRHNLLLPLNRAKELVRLVFLFQKSFGFDPDEFFNWLLDQTVAQSRKNSRGGNA